MSAPRTARQPTPLAALAPGSACGLDWLRPVLELAPMASMPHDRTEGGDSSAQTQAFVTRAPRPSRAHDLTRPLLRTPPKSGGQGCAGSAGAPRRGSALTPAGSSSMTQSELAGSLPPGLSRRVWFGSSAWQPSEQKGGAPGRRPPPGGAVPGCLLARMGSRSGNRKGPSAKGRKGLRTLACDLVVAYARILAHSGEARRVHQSDSPAW